MSAGLGVGEEAQSSGTEGGAGMKQAASSSREQEGKRRLRVAAISTLAPIRVGNGDTHLLI